AVDARIGEAQLVGMPLWERLLGPFAEESAGQKATIDSGTTAADSDRGRNRGSESTTLEEKPRPNASWTHLQFKGVGKDDAWVWFARADTFAAWQWSLMLIAMGGRLWIGKHRVLWNVGAIGFGTSIVLLLPAVVGPLAGAAWFGMVIGSLV